MWRGTGDRTIASIKRSFGQALAISKETRSECQALVTRYFSNSFIIPARCHFVPRILQDKMSLLNALVKDEVMHLHRGLISSMAMSPIGYLYMGVVVGLLVVLGFSFYVSAEVCLHFLGNAYMYSMLIFLLLLDSLYN
jgi:hypothetical protein